MAIESPNNIDFFVWSPPTVPGSINVNYGIYDLTDQYHPYILLRNDSTGGYFPWVYKTHYTISNVSINAFKIHFTQLAIDTFNFPGTLVVYRNTDLTQIVEFTEGDTLPVASFEDAFDKLTMMAQDAYKILRNSLRVPLYDMYDGNLNPRDLRELPDVANRKNKFIQFDENGDPVTVAFIDSNLTPITDWAAGLLVQPDSDSGRDYIGAAKVGGDPNQRFQVDDPIDPKDAVNLQTLLAAIPPFDKAKVNNLFTNAQFDVSQRGFLNSPPQTFNSDTFYFDRWKCVYGGNANISVQASTDVPDESLIPMGRPSYSQMFEITWQSSAMGADEVLCFQQSIEDRRLRPYQKGYVTFGAWMKLENITLGPGEFLSLVIQGPSSDWSYVHEFSIPTGVWTYVSFSVDISSLVFSDPNGSPALKVAIVLGAGNNLQTLNNDTWENGEYYSTPNCIDFSAVTGAKFYITNLLLVSSEIPITLDESRDISQDYETVFQECCRFLQVLDNPGTPAIGIDGTFILLAINFKVTMAQSTPTLQVDGDQRVTFKWASFAGEGSSLYRDVWGTFTKNGGALRANYWSGHQILPGSVIFDFTSGNKAYFTCEI